MARPDETRVTPAVKQYRPLPCGQRLHDDICVVPTGVTGLRGDAEQDRIAIGQELWTVRALTTFCGNDQLRRATICRHPHDPGRLTEQDRVVPLPAHAKWIGRGTNDDRRSSVEADTL